MKKIWVMALLMLLVVLTACTNRLGENEVRLPDLSGQTQEEILVTLSELGLEVSFIERTSIELDRSYQFIEYGNFRSSGDIVEKGTFINVIVSAKRFDSRIYFEVQTIDYDGPLLSEYFFDMDLFEYSEVTETYRGVGGAFYVNYDPANGIGRCIDGDTTVFQYPQEIFNLITSRTPSTRYFNIDTPETFPGGEEEFGKLATNYVCAQLLLAEEIVLQTDPGDNITDRHGRLLAWVWIKLPGEETFFLLNYMVVRQGLGTVEYLYGAGETEVTVYNGLTYTEWMFHAQNQAIDEALGLHGDYLDWHWDYENNRPYVGRW
ncbi:MAG: thermonuclease family protein [Candidatus Izemoplasmataceae bacterium]